MNTIQSGKQIQTSGYAFVNGIDMYYEIHSQGEPLVLIHGGGSTIQTTFGYLLPILSRHFKVVAVELQAHGHTSDRDQPSSFEQDADDVATLLQHLDIPKAHVFGFSNGGNTAMQIALRHPNAVQKLVIASSFYKRHGMFPGFFDMMKQASLVNMPGPLKTAFLAINNDEISLQNMHDKDRDRMLNFKDWDDADLRSIKAPTLLIAADHDVVTVRHTVDMSELIPNSELMIVPGDHGSFIGEVCTIRKESRIPDMTAAVIVEFLNKKELPKS